MARIEDNSVVGVGRTPILFFRSVSVRAGFKLQLPPEYQITQ
jgi:hypothetical protein